MRAALEGLGELGYDRLSMDEIASRAHAGKGALYRRWPSKAALVVDAVSAWREDEAPMAIPDTGSLAGDIEAMIAAVPDFDESARRQMSVFVGLATAAAHDADLRATLADNLPFRRVFHEVLQRAVERGEIPAERDLELLPDVMMGLHVLQILLGESPDRAHFRRALETIIYPLLTAGSPEERRFTARPAPIDTVETLE